MMKSVEIIVERHKRKNYPVIRTSPGGVLPENLLATLNDLPDVSQSTKERVKSVLQETQVQVASLLHEGGIAMRDGMIKVGLPEVVIDNRALRTGLQEVKIAVVRAIDLADIIGQESIDRLGITNVDRFHLLTMISPGTDRKLFYMGRKRVFVSAGEYTRALVSTYAQQTSLQTCLESCAKISYLKRKIPPIISNSTLVRSVLFNIAEKNGLGEQEFILGINPYDNYVGCVSFADMLRPRLGWVPGDKFEEVLIPNPKFDQQEQEP